MTDISENEDENVRIWKMKRLIKSIELSRGNGTSMVTLILPPKDQLAKAIKKLGEEYGTATNIRNRVNRQAVLSAIISAQERLKNYSQVPENGLVLYSGTVYTDDGKEKQVTIDFEPFKPINTSVYLCDSRFHTEPLQELLENDSKYGFIVMDGNGCLFGTLSGNTKRILHKFTVDLPKKHGRGGQSAQRFARLRTEKRHNYVRKVAETAAQLFLSNSVPNVQGLILAGSADFKTELSKSDLFDARLQGVVIKVVDIAYGGENGFNQAIELAAESLADVKFIQEVKVINEYFEHVRLDTNKYCFGVFDTIKALESGAVEKLVVWDSIDVIRYLVENSETEKVYPIFLNEEQRQKPESFIDPKTGQQLEIRQQEPLSEWIANNYKKYGAKIEIVSNKSQEGSQFCRGFGGIGAILRYPLDFSIYHDQSDDDIDDLDEVDSSLQQDFAQKKVEEIDDSDDDSDYDDDPFF
ncbi:peptide chain release factor subunit 1 [Anaeramoeba ignava]|uniref:Peptide chain release factor subunit 1 n=1 Tax=Anaeramoeba ignava TaxID=1746090 RepID=A0A9Q0RH63_ANAIG|nr:peptide chain release factor subunit 1 [Anaeramoeba ignava]|eukprot:Anaeramoba_ignava/a350899_91.p1 GENE.a350899_91~~a350899_91.p1  ORF type:complete len:487 (+),score=166.11 a350899_91:59-1462(+)